MTAKTLPPLPPVDHIEISDPDDPQGMPAYGGCPVEAKDVLKPGLYRGYGHGPGFEGQAELRVTESRSGVLWARARWIVEEGDVNAVREEIETEIKAINVERGTTAYDDKNRISFGYIGNLAPGYDDRSWSLFLPHPHRPGTYDDRVGSFSTNNLAGYVVLLAWIRANRLALVRYAA